MLDSSSNHINTLRLGQLELGKLLEQFDQSGSGLTNPDREFARWSFRVGAVNLTIQHTSGSRVTLPVATRNISRGGISILHAAFVHTGSRCEVTLNLPDGRAQLVAGRVVRCEHLQGRVHEVGIAFDHQISTKDLLGLDPLNEAYSLERVEPERLHGSVLLVVSSDLDRELLLMFLEDTNLAINTADTIEDAVTRAGKGCDLIVADYHLGRRSGPELIGALREKGADMPIVMMTSDKSEETLEAIRAADASGILSKPVSRDRILQALAEFLHADGDGGPLYTSLDAQNPAYPLLTKFLGDIPRMALDLEKAMREHDQEICTRICRVLSGTASPLGFPAVSSLAIAAEKKLSGHDVKAAASEIRALIVACRRIKARPAA